MYGINGIWYYAPNDEQRDDMMTHCNDGSPVVKASPWQCTRPMLGQGFGSVHMVQMQSGIPCQCLKLVLVPPDGHIQTRTIIPAKTSF